MNFTAEELHALGFRSIGRNVRIHRSVFLAGCEFISIGSNTRIDCFSLLSAGSAGIEIGDCVHVAAGCYLYGSGGRIVLADFSGLSARVSIYTASDDYRGGSMTNPTVPAEFRDQTCGDVRLEKHAIVGSGSVLLPGVTLGLGSAVGALTCVRNSVGDFEICVGGAGRTRVIGLRGQRMLADEARCRQRLIETGLLDPKP